jgi:anti-sigma factor RsiW
MDQKSIELVCREIVELVTDYLGGTLSPGDRARFDRHLSTCPPCTAYLAQMKATVEVAAELGSDPSPGDEEVARRLGQVFRRWHGGGRR